MADLANEYISVLKLHDNMPSSGSNPIYYLGTQWFLQSANSCPLLEFSRIILSLISFPIFFPVSLCGILFFSSDSRCLCASRLSLQPLLFSLLLEKCYPFLLFQLPPNGSQILYTPFQTFCLSFRLFFLILFYF